MENFVILFTASEGHNLLIGEIVESNIFPYGPASDGLWPFLNISLLGENSRCFVEVLRESEFKKTLAKITAVKEIEVEPHAWAPNSHPFDSSTQLGGRYPKHTILSKKIRILLPRSWNDDVLSRASCRVASIKTRVGVVELLRTKSLGADEMSCLRYEKNLIFSFYAGAMLEREEEFVAEPRFDCIRLLEEPNGYYPDRWIERLCTMTGQAMVPGRGLKLSFHCPQFVSHRVSVTIFFNIDREYKLSLDPGQSDSLEIHCKLEKGDRFELLIASNATVKPSQCVGGTDVRDLALMLTELVIIHE